MFDIRPLKPPSDQEQAEAGGRHPERMLGTVEIAAWLVVRTSSPSLRSGEQVSQSVSPNMLRVQIYQQESSS